MKRRTEAQEAAIRRRCLNGVCKMTKEERAAKKRKYIDTVLADPFRHALYLKYFRDRRKRKDVRDRANAGIRAKYHADIENSRKQCREKYYRMMADPERRAAYLERRRLRRHGPDGKQTAATKRAQIRERLIPRWDRVIDEGREEAYLRRTTAENARLFNMYRNSPAMFEEMLRQSCRLKGGGAGDP